MKNLIKALNQQNQKDLAKRVVQAEAVIIRDHEDIKDPKIYYAIPKICPVFGSVLKGTHGSLRVNTSQEPIIISEPRTVLDFAEKNGFKVTALDVYFGIKTKRRPQLPREYSISKSGTSLLVEFSQDRKQATISFYKKDAPQVQAFRDFLEENGYQIKLH